MKAIGVLGGTFDPVHRGHLHLADEVRGFLNLERVLLLPTARPPHKAPDALSPARHREAMLRLAIAGRTGLEICTLEMTPRRVSYTIDSLRRLRDARSPSRPVFLMGMDALIQIPTWREYERLLEQFDVAVVHRPGDALGRVRPRLCPAVASRLHELTDADREPERIARVDPGRGGRVLLVPVRTLPVSSSEIRERVAAGRDLIDLVPAAVARYIQDTGLYRQEETR